MKDTIAAIATGAAVSAIGIVRISGPEAISAAAKLFSPLGGKTPDQAENRKLTYGELRSASGELLDVCLCTVSRGPNSYTGEDTAEFQCHGSPAVLRAVLEELFRLGVRQAKPGEFTRRAFLNGRMELTAAEAVADLIDAETEEAAKNAAGQLSGAIGSKMQQIYSRLTDICSHFHAVLDYPDEDIEDFCMSAYADELAASIATLRRLTKTYSRGKYMKSGIPTAIVGKPNAGKSSLLNNMLGYERAIVTAIPGTTRDTIEEKVQLGGCLLRLTDTAGIRETEDEAEKLGVARSYEAMKQAELVIAVIDGTDNSPEADAEVLAAAAQAPHGLVVLSRKDKPEFINRLGNLALPVIEMSAVTGEGMDALEAAIAEAFPVPPVPAGEILTNARQAEAMQTAIEYLCAAEEALRMGATPDIVLTEAEGAMVAIGELTGNNIREDVTARIFARFCVGK